MKVVIDLPEDRLFFPVTPHDLRIIIMDALAEYQSHRPTMGYVEKRYPEFSEKWKEEKKARVERYKHVAELLRNNVKVEP